MLDAASVLVDRGTAGRVETKSTYFSLTLTVSWIFLSPLVVV